MRTTAEWMVPCLLFLSLANITEAAQESALRTGILPAPPAATGHKAFAAEIASQANELVLPVVVNGAVAEKLHYQTIFTVLNTSKEEISATLQVYSNAGKREGAFCSPLAPPPSGAAFTLRPGAQYVQFTSADLSFLNGWAFLQWKGPASLLVSSEVTLAAAAPAPCLLICNRPSTEKLSSVQISAVRADRDFRLPVTINRYRQTALALINPSSTDTVSVKVALYDALGENPKLAGVTSFEEKIGPHERISKFLWQMVQEHSPYEAPVPDMFQGSVGLTSDSPFAASALNIMFPEGKFVSVPIIAPAP